MNTNNFIAFFLSCGELLKQWVDSLMGTPQKELGLYQSKWGDINDGFLSSKQDGIRFGEYAISEDISMRHALCLAASGVGKTSTVVLNTALSAIGQSFIIHSEADDVFDKSSGYFKSLGYQVFKLDVSNPNESNRYNPLAHIKESSEIGKLAQLIIGSSDKSDPFWSDSSQSLLVCILSCVLQMEKEYHTLSFAKKMLTWLGGEPKKVDELMAKYGDDSTMETYKYLISISEKTFSSVLASCQASMRIFDDPNIAEVTSTNDIPLDIRSKRTVVFLKNSLHNATYVSMILGLFLHQTTKELMKEVPKGKNPRPVYILLDESTVLYKALPDLGLLLTQGRKYKLSFLVVAQNISLLSKFNDFEAIISNCYTKVYFNSLDNKTSEYVSTTLGRTTIIDDKGHEKVVPLYTPEQIRQMLHNQVIILSGNRSAYKVILKPYYKQFFLNLRSKLPKLKFEKLS